MAAFMTHPSVRIKGTENNFEPVLCAHPKCAGKPPHMHCPFCVKSEPYPDPVILKAHYRVKHVDKGLDFAGLKVLRCCDHCDIVGTIKGEKKFRGPHWHCYKCRNGFNRRDEAIKHYNTHFRNPQTTFQIQVAQEVNVMLNNMNTAENEEAAENIGDQHSNHDFKFHMHAPLEGEALGMSDRGASDVDSGYYTTECYNSYKNGDSTVAANETVENSHAEAIMIISEQGSQDNYNHKDTCLNSQLSYEEILQQKCQLERHIEQMQTRLKALDTVKIENEQLRIQNTVLIEKVEQLHEELGEFKTMTESNNSKRNEKLIEKLQSRHREFLYAQLDQLQMEYNSQMNNESSAIADEAELPPPKRAKVS